ncbi:MAG: ABC transporter ATP-binding protein [Kofleriaceae bacterium]|nr:ABC transporter ATP-binding protein [Kofleriaceae bacterium]
MTPLLEVRDLSVEFETSRGLLRAVDRISFSLDKGESLGIVGESGCGKSVTALSIMRLIRPPGRVRGAEILFHGKDICQLDESDMRAIRGNQISMIFQEPMTALNPVYTTGEQVAEAIRLHQKRNRKDALELTIAMFKLVGISSPETRVHNYPHQMSGGMRQRVMIAMALACKPELLVADEPTTALDVTIQAQILDLLAKLQAEMGLGIILITHDLGVVAEICKKVLVMYAGRIVESANVADIFAKPHHPYTVGLLASMPSQQNIGGRLQEIPGMVPSLGDFPKGCKFQDRCSECTALCRESEPELVSIGNSSVRCHHPLNVDGDESTAESKEQASNE